MALFTSQVKWCGTGTEKSRAQSPETSVRKQFCALRQTPAYRTIESRLDGWLVMFEEVLSGRLRREQADLNYAFLELLVCLFRQAGSSRQSVLGLRASLIDRLCRMRHRKRSEIAECPFSLYSLSLHDMHFWSCVRPRNIPADYQHIGISNAELALRLVNFALTALLHAWHLASTNEYAARLVLGVPRSNALALAALPVSVLSQIAERSPGVLGTRLCRHRRFWPDLIAYVDRGTKQQRAAAKLLGVQLMAASCVNPRQHRSAHPRTGLPYNS